MHYFNYKGTKGNKTPFDWRKPEKECPEYGKEEIMKKHENGTSG